MNDTKLRKDDDRIRRVTPYRTWSVGEPVYSGLYIEDHGGEFRICYRRGLNCFTGPDIGGFDEAVDGDRVYAAKLDEAIDAALTYAAKIEGYYVRKAENDKIRREKERRERRERFEAQKALREQVA